MQVTVAAATHQYGTLHLPASYAAFALLIDILLHPITLRPVALLCPRQNKIVLICQATKQLTLELLVIYANGLVNPRMPQQYCQGILRRIIICL